MNNQVCPKCYISIPKRNEYIGSILAWVLGILLLSLIGFRLWMGGIVTTSVSYLPNPWVTPKVIHK